MLVLLALLYSLLFKVGMAAESHFSLGAYLKTVADQNDQGITVANLIQGNVNQLENGGNMIQNKKAGVTQGIEGKCSTMCHDKFKSPKFKKLMGKNILAYKWSTVYGFVITVGYLIRQNRCSQRPATPSVCGVSGPEWLKQFSSAN